MRDLLIKKLMKASAVMGSLCSEFLFTTVVQKCHAIVVLQRARPGCISLVSYTYCDFCDVGFKLMEDGCFLSLGVHRVELDPKYFFKLGNLPSFEQRTP